MTEDDGTAFLRELKWTFLGCLMITIVGSTVIGILHVTGAWPGGINDERVTYSCAPHIDGKVTCLFTNTSESDNRKRCIALMVKLTESPLEWKKDFFCSDPLKSGQSIELRFSMQEEWRKCSDFQATAFRLRNLPQKVCDIAATTR